MNKMDFVSRVFDSVAPNYDLMNDVMSIGIHRRWKNIFLNKLKPNKRMSLVDVGGGTGDIAFRFLSRGGKNVIIIDANKKMLRQGKSRELQRNYQEKITWINGNAENLPLKSGSADAYTASFCIRNVTSIEHSLAEAYRVLKPGGQFICLEFSRVSNPLCSKLYNAYSSNILPWLGSVIAKDRDAYQYLVDSIRNFPDQKTFLKLIQDAGFCRVSYTNLSSGIVAIHSGWRI